jgi:hypothetical protein
MRGSRHSLHISCTFTRPEIGRQAFRTQESGHSSTSLCVRRLCMMDVGRQIHGDHSHMCTPLLRAAGASLSPQYYKTMPPAIAPTKSSTSFSHYGLGFMSPIDSTCANLGCICWANLRLRAEVSDSVQLVRRLSSGILTTTHLVLSADFVKASESQFAATQLSGGTSVTCKGIVNVYWHVVKAGESKQWLSPSH